ncbi:MAG: esterase-like activity of phytase family protein [Flavobacteriaceae bacterium]
MNYKYIFLILLSVQLIACKTTSSTATNSNVVKAGMELRFIGEQLLPENTFYNETEVGGLSSIDYAKGKYYLISDDKKKTRFYEMDLIFNEKTFSEIEITNVIYISNEDKGLDPEGLRFDESTGNFYWISEGFIRDGVSPSIYEIDTQGKSLSQTPTPKMFHARDSNYGPRKNGTFEGLSLSNDKKHLWIAMELPLIQDGEKPQLKEGKYPIRVSKIDKKTGELIYQFAYNLNKTPRDSNPKGRFSVNGVSEILVLDDNRFLVVERAFSKGHKDGGNTIKIFLVNSSKATNITNMDSLKNADYTLATKTLVFDFDNIRSKLTNGIIDNIEGITFGPKLDNGNKTLILVTDNNFKKFNKQLNQFIILEVLSDF